MNKLIEAVKFEDLKTVQALITAKADLNAKGKYGQTALYLASFYGYTEIVKALIDAGADVNAKNEAGYGKTALSGALHEGHNEIAKILKDAGAKE